MYLIKNEQRPTNEKRKSGPPEKLGAFNQFVRINISDLFLVKLFGIFSSFDLKSISKWKEKEKRLTM